MPSISIFTGSFMLIAPDAVKLLAILSPDVNLANLSSIKVLAKLVGISFSSVPTELFVGSNTLLQLFEI